MESASPRINHRYPSDQTPGDARISDSRFGIILAIIVPGSYLEHKEGGEEAWLENGEPARISVHRFHSNPVVNNSEMSRV